MIPLKINLAEKYFNQGNAESVLHQYADAVKSYTMAIRKNPNYMQAYYNRGNIHYYNLENYKQAIADFTRAIQIDPNFEPAYTNRGNAYKDMGYCKEALEDYVYAIQLDPTDALNYYNIGIMMVEDNALQKSLAYFERSAQLGLSQAVKIVTQIKQKLGMDPTLQTNLSQQALDAFQYTESPTEIQRATICFPLLLQSNFIATIEQVIAQVPPERRPAFEQRLDWLRQIANK
jgi:tetratricopeptide (TPR) repeat protein